MNKLICEIHQKLGMLGVLAIVAGAFLCYQIADIAIVRLFEPSITTRLTSCVSQINEVGKLKVLRLIGGGFVPSHKIYDAQSNSWASASFMYHGMVDIFLDFKNVRVESMKKNESRTLLIVMPPFEPGPVRETPEMTLDDKTRIENKNLELVPLYEAIKGDSRLGQKLWHNLEPIRARYVKEDAMASENIARAKQQAETILRTMFASFVEIPYRDIEFRWPEQLTLIR